MGFRTSAPKENLGDASPSETILELALSRNPLWSAEILSEGLFAT
jgi:hypothetical protein